MKQITAMLFTVMAVFSQVSVANDHCDKDHQDKAHCK